MPYTTNIPAATDIPAQSQTLMQQNCTELQTAISRNHEPLGNANSGQHINIEFTGAGTVPTTNFGMYATAAAILMRNAGVNYDITTFTNGFVGGVGQGSVTLPSGLVIKFGRIQSGGAGITTINFTSAFAGGILVAFASVQDTNFPSVINASVYNFTNALLRAKVTNYAGTAYAVGYFSWLAIGY